MADSTVVGEQVQTLKMNDGQYGACVHCSHMDSGVVTLVASALPSRHVTSVPATTTTTHSSVLCTS